ncbi:hypothetical protein [Pedobacter sp. L105]|uniref:hypothetical protein n=1 Tax=Pedobacter sp. L105 TaxID=1641871 RepID=UPI00131D8B47|nr:hypothetical protein [Pedobacter sp. L105]
MYKVIYPGFAGILILLLAIAGVAQGQTVTLDYYFNHESHHTADGDQRYHYLWEDHANTGFSIWGNSFKQLGMTLRTLETAPTEVNLKGTSIYIIVDPDNSKESPQPNYILEKDAVNISKWVKAGGILVMMANDSANVELPHLNILAGKFGLHFNNDLQNHVIDDAHFNDGTAIITDMGIFKTATKVFLKDVCSIQLTGEAKAVLKSANGAVIACKTRYGKGTVFAVGDPWLYNEYVNGRLTTGFENDKAAADLALWLKKQIP